MLEKAKCFKFPLDLIRLERNTKQRSFQVRIGRETLEIIRSMQRPMIDEHPIILEQRSYYLLVEMS